MAEYTQGMELREPIDPRTIDRVKLRAGLIANPPDPAALVLAGLLGNDGYNLNTESVNPYTGQVYTGINWHRGLRYFARGANLIIDEYLPTVEGEEPLNTGKKLADPLCMALTACNLYNGFSHIGDYARLAATGENQLAPAQYAAESEKLRKQRGEIVHKLLHSKISKTGELTVLEWIEREAKSGNAYAATVAGMIYIEGVTVAKNLGVAIKYYETAAAAGMFDGILNVGLYKFANGKLSEAEPLFKKVADTGMAAAQYFLAELYLKKCDKTTNTFPEAIEYYMLAAAQGYDPALAKLVKLYALSDDPRDKPRGVSSSARMKALKKAALGPEADAVDPLDNSILARKVYEYNFLLAEKGSIEASKVEAELLIAGKGVEKDVGAAAHILLSLLDERTAKASTLLKVGPVVTSLMPLKPDEQATIKGRLNEVISHHGEDEVYLDKDQNVIPDGPDGQPVEMPVFYCCYFDTGRTNPDSDQKLFSEIIMPAHLKSGGSAGRPGTPASQPGNNAPTRKI